MEVQEISNFCGDGELSLGFHGLFLVPEALTISLGRENEVG